MLRVPAWPPRPSCRQRMRWGPVRICPRSDSQTEDRMGRMFRQILDTFTRVAMGCVRRRPAPPPCAHATWRTRWRFFDGSDPSNRHRDGVGTTGAAGGPHVIASIFGARLAQRLATRLIFEGDPLRDQDPIGRTIPDMGVLDRLVTPPGSESLGVAGWPRLSLRHFAARPPEARLLEQAGGRMMTRGLPGKMSP